MTSTEARARALVDQFIGDTKDHAYTMIESVDRDRLVRVIDAALQAQLATCEARVRVLEGELRNIAEADTLTWDDPEDFTAWAQHRARHTLTPPTKEAP